MRKSANHVLRGAAGVAVAATLLAGGAPAARAQGFDERGGGYGFGGGFGGGYGRGTESSARSGLWEGRLRTDRAQYPRSRGVEITVLLTNTTGRAASVGSNVGASEYTLTVRDARTNRVVWTYSKPNRGVIRVEPRGSRVSREFWDQRDSAGKRVPAGAYRLEAVLIPSMRMETTIYLQDGRGDGGDDRPGGGGRPTRPGTPGDLNPPWGGGGAGRPGGRPGDGIPGPPAAQNPILRGVVRPDRATVRPGDRVGFNFTVTNAGRTRQTYRFPTGTQYEVGVRDARGRTVWSYSRDMVAIQAFTEFWIDPGQGKNFFAHWSVPRDLPRGTYEVFAHLPTTSGDVGAARARLVVE